MANSDVAMYRAKGSSNHKLFWYELEMSNERRARNEMAVDIKKGLDEGWGANILYRSQFLMKDKIITGHTAMLYWKHPLKGSIPQELLLSIAEENGLIIELGCWVIEKICDDILKNNIDKIVSIKLHPLQLKHGEFLEKVIKKLSHSPIPLNLLQFEIAETEFISNNNIILNELHTLKKLGARIALGEYGAKYASLNILKTFEFDVINIDRDLLFNIDDVNISRSILKAIVDLGASLNINLVAEGVEKEEGEITFSEEFNKIQLINLGEPTEIEKL